MPAPGRPSVGELWLGTLERIAGRAAHELKGVLNGVGVNLEVVRLRSARAEAPASGVAAFAQSATDQFELVTAMTEALLALARPVRDPLELGTILAQYATLLVPAARADGVSLAIQARLPGPAPLAVAGNVARLVLGATFLAALDDRRDAACAVELTEVAAVRIEWAEEAPLNLSLEMLAAAAEAGVDVRSAGHGLTIAFPLARITANETA